MLLDDNTIIWLVVNIDEGGALKYYIHYNKEDADELAEQLQHCRIIPIIKEPDEVLEVGNWVEECAGDKLRGEIVAVFTTTAGKTRYVVEYTPVFLRIYSKNDIKRRW